MKKRRLGATVAALAVAAALSLAGIQAPASAATFSVTVDPGIRSRPFGGWGTSLAWFANYTGSWTNRDQMADLLFGTTNTDAKPSLMLNIARYDIGGGNDPAFTANMRTGAAVPGYKASATAAYDWTADANQRWWLAAAKSRVPASQFVADAVSYSAPSWMTQSGQSTGNTSGSADNLQTGKEAAFAQYLTDVVKHFHDSWGTDFRSLDPMNEPSTNYWVAGGKQEGMHVSPGANQAALLNATYSALTSKGLTTTLAGVDETSIDLSTSDLQALATAGFDFSKLAQVNFHTYSRGDAGKLFQLAVGTNGKRFQMSEMTTSTGTHDHNSIAAALGLASEVSKDMYDLQPDEWVYWQALESEKESVDGNGNWGLVHYLTDGSQTWAVTKKFHVMRQYTNFVRPGSVSLYNSDPNTLVSLDAATGKLAVIVHNDATTPTAYDYDLSKFATVGTADVYRTSSTENRKLLATAATASKHLAVTLAPQSVTTFVIPVTGGTGNLVQNPTFDVGPFGQNIPGWLTWGGGPGGANLDADYTQAGGHTAGGDEGVQWKASPYSVYTWQTAKVPNGTYTLSAWVKSSGGQTTAALVAKNYGGADKQVAIPTSATYVQVTIPNIVVTNGKVELGFSSVSPANKWISFDDVTLQ